ncbi:protein RIC-3-like [Pelecanus crispus]|uniref:protein RIC-3-like n=1 Tax=Pelecanus crispus TaxID=36300 RepID=UPI003F5D00EF
MLNSVPLLQQEITLPSFPSTYYCLACTLEFLHMCVSKSERAENPPVYDNSDCFKRKQDTLPVDYPDLSQPSAEKLAERMEDMEDEEHLCNETLLSDLTIGREERVLHHSQSTEECCCCYEDDDPAVIAENAGFHSESCSEAEESTQEDLSVESENENAALKKQKASDSDETGTLRKRNTKGLE